MTKQLKLAKMNTQIRNHQYEVETLKTAYTGKISNLVDEYIADQNCYPDLCINGEDLTEQEKAVFIFHCLNHKNYGYKATLAVLKKQLDSIYAEMPETFFQLEQRNKSAFLISREIEKLENPIAYHKNKAHWEGHEIRL